MKRKITKINNVKDMQSRLAGVAVWRVTGPDQNGQRVTVEFTGTRQQAESVELQLYKGEK